MKGKYSWFPTGNIIWNHVNIFIHTDYLSSKLDIISVANCEYRATDLIVPSSFINIRQAFKFILIFMHIPGIWQSVLCASRPENL